MAVQQPFLNPRLPFTGSIKGGLYEGKSITVTGRVLPGAERFHVNLCTKGQAEIALHFNPRYSGNSGYIVCNTKQGSSWGSEERKSGTPLPRGADFTLTFLVNRDSYSVIVNGAHLLEYKHRLAATGVIAISVEGGVEIQSIAFQNPATFCPPQPAFPHPSQGGHNKSRRGKAASGFQRQPSHHNQVFAPAPGFVAAPPPYSPPQAFTVPYKTVIQGGLYPGRNIIVQGLVNHNADRFCINLRFNSGIALHFNPRFNENTVVRNTQLQDKWGPEERAGGMPFYRGQPFMVTIVCDTQCYKIMVNGVQMFTYKHRHFLFQQIDILEVMGDVSLSSVMV
ncbi:galectin-9 [Chanos chanos]|uniref:Galectin n=1 Tax=Chanos chanos TaxID=29144 RepID=A0A6J2WUL5_CHACN|nr:galectin-9-like [Chanos chanos]